MKKILFLLVTLSLLSCSNDDDNAVENNNSPFLAQEYPQFTAMIDNESIDWKYGNGTYEMSNNFTYPNVLTDPHRSLVFTLNTQNNSNRIAITTPVYNTSSVAEFNKVFGLGVKKIGDASDEYHLNIINNYQSYQVCNSEANYKIEVLKTQEVLTDPNNPILKVWFKIDNIELNNCNPSNSNSLNDGLLLAHFTFYKSE